LFGPDESILSLGDNLYGKPLLIQRGKFSPVTMTHMDLFEKGQAQFKKEFPKAPAPLALFELTMRGLQVGSHNEESEGSGSALHSEKDLGDQVDERDFLQRVRALAKTGHHVLVSNFFLFYRLKQFLRMTTQEPLGLIVPANHLGRLFDPKHYQDLGGGILEGLGKLMDEKTHLYIYPHKTQDSCSNSKSFFPSPALLPIYQYFQNQAWITDLTGCDAIMDYIHSDLARTQLQAKAPGWEKLVPPAVADYIKKDELFGYKK
jgi:hypothetical protein